MAVPGSSEPKRGLLKPEQRLQWKSSTGDKAPATGAKKKPISVRPAHTKGLPTNAMPQAQFTMEELKKMAAARGLSVEKLLAQMVQQYLKEE